MLNFILVIHFLAAYSKENTMKTAVNFRLNKGCDIYEEAIHEIVFMVRVFLFFFALLNYLELSKEIGFVSIRLENVNSDFHGKFETLYGGKSRGTRYVFAEKTFCPQQTEEKERKRSEK
jgi:hypothetical protein